MIVGWAVKPNKTLKTFKSRLVMTVGLRVAQPNLRYVLSKD